MKGKVATVLVKTAIALPLIIFAVWLLQLVYFPRLEGQKAIAVAKSDEEDIFKKILKNDEPVHRDHFHMVDEFVSQPEHNPPLCLSCHGTFPHAKEKKVRSLLNFHTGFIACAVCHARQEPGQHDIVFTWIDRRSGQLLPGVDGEYGKYPAKIFPIRISGGSSEHVFRPVSAKAAQQFLKIQDELNPDQIAQAKIKLHENISSEPVFCSDCHQKDGYLDFAKLGFPRNRVAHLASTEVVGLIEKYKTFYLPSKIDFGAEKTAE